MEKSETQYLDLAGGRLAYDVTGPADGPLVVCTPGLGDVRQVYRFLTPRLAEAGYRVATLDLRGSGESGTGWPGYDAPAIGGDILALVDELGGRAALIGNSYTGASVAWAAATAPDKVAGVLMFDPFTRVVTKSRFVRIAEKVVSRFAAVWTMYYKYLYPTAKPADFDNYLGALRASLRRPGRMAVLRAMVAGTHEVTEPLLASVRCPVVVAMGTKDPDFPDPADEARQVANLLTGTPARIETIADAGHYPFAEMPDAAAPVVLALLSEAFDA